MSANRFEKIKEFIQFGNNENALPFSDPQHDRLFKLRPVIEKLKERFQIIPFKECLSIDEQICATKARNYLKQYLPSKPNKWGYKLFVFCVFQVFLVISKYTQARKTMHRLPHEPYLRASGNIVIRLTRKIPTNVNHKLFFYNYYTSVGLLVHLSKQGIPALGAMRGNGIPCHKVITDEESNLKMRGDSVKCKVCSNH